MGDIVFDQTEVYGDAVNLASRIQNLASPSSILVSGKVNDELKNQPSISTIRLGACELKNVSGHVEIFAISSIGIKVPQPFGSQTLNKKQNSIAVLPFANLSSKDNAGCIGEGISEEIINAIAKIKGVNIKSRKSSFASKGDRFP